MNYKSTESDNDELNDISSALAGKISSIIDKLRTQLNTTTDDSQKSAIAARIAELTALQTDISNYQSNINTLYTDNAYNVRTLTDYQSRVEQIIDSESQNNQDRLDMLNAEKYNKVRLIQNNVYYGKYYSAHKQIMKTIFLVCVPVLILLILGNMGIMPPNLNSVFIMIIIIIGCISIGYQIIDLSNRDNMNFDEYNWKFNKKLAPPIKTNVQPYDPWETAAGPNQCINGACCPDDYKYDSESNKCVPK
jgi:hypothetical protein